jgi:hypothetical protein
VVDFLASGLNIVTGAVVTRVTQGSRVVTIATAAGKVRPSPCPRLEGP